MPKINSLPKDYIAIDTNVLEHIFNPQKNTNDHITELLRKLFREDKIKLLVDTKKRILNEYLNRLKRIIEANPQSPKVALLQHSINVVFHEQIEVNHDEPLMRKIKNIIEESTDSIFIYVAFKKYRILITNDEDDIINERDEVCKQCRKLLKNPKINGHKKEIDILTSKEAHDVLISEKEYGKITNQS